MVQTYIIHFYTHGTEINEGVGVEDAVNESSKNVPQPKNSDRCPKPRDLFCKGWVINNAVGRRQPDNVALGLCYPRLLQMSTGVLSLFILLWFYGYFFGVITLLRLSVRSALIVFSEAKFLMAAQVPDANVLSHLLFPSPLSFCFPFIFIFPLLLFSSSAALPVLLNNRVSSPY